MAEGQLTGYAQFPGSDCLNGGVIRVRDGHKLMERAGLAPLPAADRTPRSPGHPGSWAEVFGLC